MQLNDSRTIEEQYTSAGNADDLTVKADQRGEADVLIAAGWTPGMLGGALMRLHSEWDGSERMRPAVAADFVGAARQRPADSRKPVQTASELLTAAQKMAHDHNTQQAKLLMGNLKTMPRVVGILTEWAVMRALPAPHALAQAVVAFWLDGNCHSCHGRGNEVIHGSPVLGRQCRKCGGSGKRQAPGGEVGKAALNMMDECVHVARQSMRLRLRNML